MVLPGIRALFGFRLIARRADDAPPGTLPHGACQRFVWLASQMVLAGMVLGAALLAVFVWLWFLLPRRERSRHAE
jgi:hypothetical protein